MKTVLITGAARGIGKGCAIAFARKGYNVAINYNNSQKEAEILKSDILSNGLSAEIFKADVSREEEAKRLTYDVVSRFGKIDVLINNAGKALYKPFDEVTDLQWQNLCACDLSSVIYCTKYAVKDMLPHRFGRIINISSMWGERGASCEAHYSAVKAGVIGFTKALSKEYAPCGITVNCITPGVIDTDMLNIFSAQEKAELISRTPCARLGTPYDVAAAALFFADAGSDFITGQVLGVDGGFI
ncbi:MAG: 3-oxoacyl-ACP reductase FabG [Clostridiales bacterium]|nr:3-oxoacyl-ACP reductase FabG [Clostridiales bacterium]